MNETKATSGAGQTCETCGKLAQDCSCGAHNMAPRWPSREKQEKLQDELFSGEATAKFLRLKEAGTGTIFLPAAAESRPSQPFELSIDLAPGAIIGGVYQIIQLIGVGGMGEVYSAIHLPLNKKCALKVIPPSEVTDVGWQRFQLEAKIVAKLEHINLVRVTDLGLHEGCLPFYAMEYLEGKNLAEILAEEGPQPLQKVLEIFVQVCDGVECAHAGGVLHRDLKPANIMLTTTPAGRMVIKILDFGLAKLTRHDRVRQSLTGSEDVFGSPCYMSPEQCGDTELDSRSDIYSIGCTLFEALTGRPPFFGTIAAAVFFGHLEAPPPTLEKAHGSVKFPRLMEVVMAKMLTKDRNRRYQTLSEVRADLVRVYLEQYGPFHTTSMEKLDLSDDNRPAGATATKARQVRRGKAARAVKAGRRVTPAPRFWLALSCAAVFGLGASFTLGGLPGSFDLADIYPRPNEAAPSSPSSRARIQARPAMASAGTAAHGSGANAAGVLAPPGRYPEGDDIVAHPFYQGPVSREGKTMQHWQYRGLRPAPLYLIYLDDGALKEEPLVGDVYIPVGAQVCAMPRQALVHAPSLSAGLKGAPIDEIDYEWYSLSDIETANPDFSQCPRVKGLRIGNFLWTKADGVRSVAAINQFSNLERLILDGSYSGADLARLRRLADLTELRLNGQRIRTHDCLARLAGARKLEFLAVISWGAPSSDLALLSQCQGLKRLLLGQLTGSHEQFALLSHLKGLERLELPSLRYRPDLASDLKSLKSLKSLSFFFSSDWREGELADLKRDVPGLEIKTYKGVKEIREAFWLP